MLKIKGLEKFVSKFLPADLLFITDALAGGLDPQHYHAFLQNFGIAPEFFNVLVSFAEVLRIGYLVYKRKN